MIRPSAGQTPGTDDPGARAHPHPFRRQPPVELPFRAIDLFRALRDALPRAPDPRPALADLLRARFHADAVELHGSGTSALAAAIGIGIRAAGRGPVALPAFTCYDVATAAIASDVGVLFYDVDPITLGPDESSLRSALRRGARIVVLTPLFGFAVGWDSVHRLAREHGAFLVEDAAQGHGAYFSGRPVGSLGDVSVISFGRGKGWTGGRGGALLLRGDAARRNRTGPTLPAPSWMAEARLAAELTGWLLLGRPSLYWMPAALPWLRLGTSIYRGPRSPQGLPRISAALALRSRTYAARAVWRRRRMAHLWRRWIPERSAVRHVHALDRAEPGYLRYPLLLAIGMDGFGRPDVALRLGIARSYPHPLFGLSQLRPCILHPVASCPGAEELARKLVTLPTHSLLSAAEVRGVIGLMAGYGVRRGLPVASHGNLPSAERASARRSTRGTV